MLVLGAALVTSLEVRGRDKESKGKKSEDTSEHSDEQRAMSCWREQMRVVGGGPAG